MLDRFQHPSPMIRGVCAWLAERSDVPVLIIRIVALALLITHLPLMVIGYFAGAWLIRRQARRAGALDLETRLARAEEAAWGVERQWRY